MLTNLISRIRRNHAMEHATIHVLSEKHERFGVQGNATAQGFYLNLYGRFTAAEVEEAAREALARLQRGQHHLALHPNCGTVLLTTAVLATVTGQAVFGFEQKRLRQERLDWWTFVNVLPTAVLATVMAIIVSRPLGMYFQGYTTDGRPGGLVIGQVLPLSPSPLSHFFRLLLGRDKKTPMHSFFIQTHDHPTG